MSRDVKDPDELRKTMPDELRRFEKPEPPQRLVASGSEADFKAALDALQILNRMPQAVRSTYRGASKGAARSLGTGEADDRFEGASAPNDDGKPVAKEQAPDGEADRTPKGQHVDPTSTRDRAANPWALRLVAVVACAALAVAVRALVSTRAPEGPARVVVLPATTTLVELPASPVHSDTPAPPQPTASASAEATTLMVKTANAVQPPAGAQPEKPPVTTRPRRDDAEPAGTGNAPVSVVTAPLPPRAVTPPTGSAARPPPVSTSTTEIF